MLTINCGRKVQILIKLNMDWYMIILKMGEMPFKLSAIVAKC